MTRLAATRPVRTQKVSRRCVTGKVALSSGGTAAFESSLERDWLLILDFDPTVRRIVVQPFSIIYYVSGSERRYTPDVLVEHEVEKCSSRIVVYEVKPRDELRENREMYRARFQAAAAFCRGRDWKFQIVTETKIRTPILTNARFLKRYRSLRDESTTREKLLYTLKGLGQTTPQALLAASFWHEESQMAALPMLWKLVAQRTVAANLREPLTMSSKIWLSDS